MVLNCFYFIYVRGDPSLAGKFDINANDTTGDKFLWPIIMTICLLIVYYAQYSMALSLGCIKMASDDGMPKARKVSFFTGIIVHFFFILCVLFGVFNRHFANGGVQLLAYTVINLYVYLLCILNWPVVTYQREYEIAEDQVALQSSGPAGFIEADLPRPESELLSGSPDVKRFRSE